MAETKADLLRSLADWLDEPPELVIGTGRLNRTIEALRIAAELIEGVEDLTELIESYVFDGEEKINGNGFTPYECGKFVAYANVLDMLCEMNLDE